MAAEKKAPKWLPLTSDPAVMESYSRGIGAPPNTRFQDILSTESWALDMIEGSTIGVVLLFPLKPAFDDRTHAEDAAKDGSASPKDVWFTKQTVSNACGTVGLLHVFGNTEKPMVKDGPLDKFYTRVKGMTPEQRAKELETETVIGVAHETAAHSDSVKLPAEGETVNHHFVAFVEVGGRLVELDGRRKYPNDRGSSSSKTLLADASAFVKAEYMDRDPGDYGYSLIAVTCDS